MSCCREAAEHRFCHVRTGQEDRACLKVRYLNCNALFLLFCSDRRSKYSKAKQEADEEKHLNQGKRQWCLFILDLVQKTCPMF